MRHPRFLSLTIVFLCLAASAQDLQKFLDDAVKAGQKRIVIPPGDWRVKPVGNQHLNLKNLHDIEIVADNVRMICTKTTRAVTVENCTNLTLAGLTVDYDPLPFTQFRIIGISPDGLTHEVEVEEGYRKPAVITDHKYEIYGADTHELSCPTYYGVKVKTIQPGKYRISIPKHYKSTMTAHPPKTGDFAIIGVSDPKGQYPHAFYTRNSRNVTYRNVKLYASNCFGFVEGFCSGNKYLNCVIDRCPPALDLKKRSSRRMRSLNADGYHSKNAEVGPQIIGCVAKYNGDDAVNINGDYQLVLSQNGKSLLTTFKREITIRPDDLINIWLPSGEMIRGVKVLDVKASGKVTDDERGFIKTLWLINRFKNGENSLLSSRCEVILKKEVNVPRGSVICSSSRTGNGFAVKDCDFGHNRSRSILIKASNGVIENNKITGCWSEAIKVSPEYVWLEAGSSCNLKIINNVIKDTNSISIGIYALNSRKQDSPAGAHANIELSGNRINNSPLPGLCLCSIDGLTMKNNILEPSGKKHLQEWIAEVNHLVGNTAPIVIRACKNTKQVK